MQNVSGKALVAGSFRPNTGDECHAAHGYLKPDDPTNFVDANHRGCTQTSFALILVRRPLRRDSSISRRSNSRLFVVATRTGWLTSVQESDSEGVRLLMFNEKLRKAVQIGVDQANKRRTARHDTVFGQQTIKGAIRHHLTPSM